MKAYYNENDKFAAAWLRELIKAGLIMDGDVDERSIVDVRPEDLEGYDRCHFFAGIGGWELALQLAVWDGPVWTGSCPCQPFSSAGKGKGTADERHLWPEFARLIRECKPPVVFGEQVASKAGRKWFDGVSTDLEGMGYAAAAADLCAASVGQQSEVEIIDEFSGEVVYRGRGVVGPPHIRQRLFWVADDQGRNGRLSVREKQGEALELIGGGKVCCGLGDTNSGRRQQARRDEQGRDREAIPRQQAGGHSSTSPWHDFDLIRCVEPTKEPGRYVEKRRRVEPGLVPLAHGLPERVGRLRGYGNAIVPQVAAEFIQAYMETL